MMDNLMMFGAFFLIVIVLIVFYMWQTNKLKTTYDQLVRMLPVSVSSKLT